MYESLKNLHVFDQCLDLIQTTECVYKHFEYIISVWKKKLLKHTKYIIHFTLTGCSRTDFGPQLNHFNKQDFTLIAFDPRGYGQSIPPYRDWPLEFIQRDAEDAIELVQVS